MEKQYFVFKIINNNKSTKKMKYFSKIACPEFRKKGNYKEPKSYIQNLSEVPFSKCVCLFVFRTKKKN